MFINNYRGKKGAGMGPRHHCRAEKRDFSGAVQVPRFTNLNSSEMCDESRLQTKETSWPDTDYRSYFIYISLNILFCCKERVG
jgi:hypothetical protein